MTKISVIIPTTGGKAELWRDCFSEYEKQIYPNFEIIIVFNTNETELLRELKEISQDYSLDTSFVHHPSYSAADARNIGVAHAQSDVFLFVGDDCVPSRGLILNHVNVHLAHENKLFGVQGYSPFCPSIMDSQFMQYIDEMGVQANWQNVLNSKLSFGFCLTTNFSIGRETWNMLRGFREFPKAAWEDVEFGYRMNKLQIPTVFEVEAVNYHRHLHDLESFANRQRMEGANRFLLWLEQPEMLPSMLDLEQLKFAKDEDLDEWIEVGNQVSGIDLSRIPDAKQVVYDTYAQVLQMGSLKGICDYIDSNQGTDTTWGVMEYVYEATTHQQVTYLMNLHQSLLNDDYGYAAHCLEWLRESGMPQNVLNRISEHMYQ